MKKAKPLSGRRHQINFLLQMYGLFISEHDGPGCGYNILDINNRCKKNYVNKLNGCDIICSQSVNAIRKIADINE